jgi:transcriptional regulator with XRE-family HTH domain
MPDTGKPTPPRKFAKWLDLTLANAGMTGKELARVARLDEAQVSRWRRGKGKPSLESCERLANAFGVDPMRLAVTAGALPARMAGAEPLPMPPNTAVIEQVRGKLRDLPGATEKSVEEMLEAFRRGIEE